MHSIRVNNKTYKLPSGWKEVKLGQFCKLMSQYSQLPKDYDQIEIAEITISILANCPIDDLGQLEMTDVHKILDLIKWVNTLPSEKYKQLITIDGKEYGLTPTVLNPKFKEYIDLDALLKDPKKYWDNFSKLIAILCRPVTKKKRGLTIMQQIRLKLKRVKYQNIKTVVEVEEYDFTKLPGRIKLFEERLSIEDVYGMALFFYSFAKNCSLVTNRYLEEELKQELRLTEKKHQMSNS